MSPSLRAAAQPVVQRAEPCSNTGETRGTTRFGLYPIIDDCGFAGLGPWAGRQIVRLLFHRAG